MSTESISYKIPSPIDEEAYSVAIDSSEELTKLIKTAEEAQDFPFEKKLQTIQDLATAAMENAWEGYCTSEGEKKEKYRSIIFTEHPLSEALKQKMGCCRYQALLFFVLAGAAKLGDKHYVQNVPVADNVNTCFNDIVYKGKTYHVSIFMESLKNKDLNYSKDPTIYERPNVHKPGQTFLSYVKNSDEVTYYRRTACHADADLENVMQFQKALSAKKF